MFSVSFRGEAAKHEFDFSHSFQCVTHCGSEDFVDKGVLLCHGFNLFCLPLSL